MKHISANDWQLLSFFEVEPELVEADDPWPYVDALYRVVQGKVSLSCAIHPAYRDVQIILEYDGNRIYEFNAMGVEDVRYIKESDVELLEIVIGGCDVLKLRIKPHIEIQQEANIE